jgi:hypothetical protein
MVTLRFLFLALIVLLSVHRCNYNSPEKICDDESKREKIISVLLTNEVYRKQIMDSIRKKDSSTFYSMMPLMKDSAVARR